MRPIQPHTYLFTTAFLVLLITLFTYNPEAYIDISVYDLYLIFPRYFLGVLAIILLLIAGAIFWFITKRKK